jgi:serine/threonine protein phosphatase PrpC
MQVSTQGFHAPKRGNVESEYEDAYFPVQACREVLSEFRCAIADGASESAFSREWARLLVRGHHRHKLSLARLQSCWMRLVTRRPVPWYLEEKIRRGAHATFVGLSIRDAETPQPQGGSWRVVAVGDSCLFHVRGDQLLTVAPMSKSDEFNNHPHLISTDPATAFGLGESRPTVISGEWQPDDVFFLLTDALAEWTLSKHEAGRPPWTLFRSLGEDGDSGENEDSSSAGQALFESLVAELREKDGLHNDDTTLLRVGVA